MNEVYIVYCNKLKRFPVKEISFFGLSTLFHVHIDKQENQGLWSYNLYLEFSTCFIITLSKIGRIFFVFWGVGGVPTPKKIA